MQAAKNSQGDLKSSKGERTLHQQSTMIERKQGRKVGTNLFKKKKEEGNPGTREVEKRCWSSEGMKLLKRNSAEDRTAKKQPVYPQEMGVEGIGSSPSLTESQNLPSGHYRPPSSARQLVFNKFSSQERIKIQEYLLLLKDQTAQTVHNQAMTYIINKIRIYIQQLQDNNSKLLEVNYFFQKEFSRAIASKNKNEEKCKKNYCLECRYHLEKENRWKQEKKQMISELQRLRTETSSERGESDQHSSKDLSLMVEDSKAVPGGSTQPIVQGLKCEIEQLRGKLVERDEEYLVLVKEVNYLDSINKDVQKRLSTTIEEYKYLSIENRTLLGAKSKLLEKELECSKVKNQRDQFKKKLIELHKKMQRNRDESESEEELCSKCKAGDRSFNREESVFTLSSLSTQRHTSEINQHQF